MHRRHLSPLLATLALVLACAEPAVARPPSPGPTAHSAATRTIKLKDSFFSPSSVRASGKATRALRLGRDSWPTTCSAGAFPKSYADAAIRHSALTRTYGRGIYTFECTIHPGMSFKLRVR